ncbi:MAG: DUF5615 family PIN-like protein [Bacteroidota bacterium]
MAAVRFYTDEHVPRAVIEGLRHHGADVVSTPEAGMLGKPDAEHLAFALREGRVVYTQDDDFLKLAAAGAAHAGVAYLRQGASIGQAVRGLLRLHAALSAEEMVGRIEFL